MATFLSGFFVCKKQLNFSINRPKEFHFKQDKEYKNYKKGESMKALSVLILIFSINIYSAEIKNGNFEISINDRTEIMKGGCSTFTDGQIVGISNMPRDVLNFVYEMEVPVQTDMTAESFSVSKSLGVFSAKGFCASQKLLSSLEMIYSKSKDKVSVSYKFRCNRKKMIKTVSCLRL